VLEPISKDAKGQGLSSCDRLVTRIAVRQDAWQIRHLGDPSAIFFALDIDGEIHSDLNCDCGLPSAARYGNLTAPAQLRGSPPGNIKCVIAMPTGAIWMLARSPVGCSA
jgi:hypothetical protein